MAVGDNTKAGNSVKQTLSVLHIRGCAHLPLQQVFKIIMSQDSTFYKLHSDIYFAKVLSLAMCVRTIFRKTPLKVYSTLKQLNGACSTGQLQNNNFSTFTKLVILAFQNFDDHEAFFERTIASPNSGHIVKSRQKIKRT